MKIYIPTRGRPARQIFFQALPDTLKKCVVFVCNRIEDAPIPLHCADVALTPKWVQNIGDKRHYIVHELHQSDVHGPEVIMCDDDLRLNARRKDDPTKFHAMLDSHYHTLFMAMYELLGFYAHLTVCPREGGNRVLEDQECTRAMRILGYNADVVRKERIDFRRCPTKEDFDATLQLLRKGYKNRMLTAWVQDDGGGSNARGGCSIYRDNAYMDGTARALADLHPGFVKVVQKVTKGAWGGGTRTDVNIQWKKAYESSQS